MQASKIRIGDIYAIAGEGLNLRRFRVECVVTRRHGNVNSPHNNSSMIEGRVVAEDLNGAEPKTLVLDPQAILGPYQDYLDLKQREAVEKKAKQAKEEADKAVFSDLYRLLYHLTGLENVDTGSFNKPFLLGYSDLRINLDGAKALLPALRKLAEPS